MIVSKCDPFRSQEQGLTWCMNFASVGVCVGNITLSDGALVLWWEMHQSVNKERGWALRLLYNDMAFMVISNRYTIFND